MPQTKQAELTASATKKGVQLKASSKQLDKLNKDIVKLGECDRMGGRVAEVRLPGCFVALGRCIAGLHQAACFVQQPPAIGS
jgi:hypothetical protein